MAGVVLNDAGPALETDGLNRLRKQVGRGGPWPSWLTAARDLAARDGAQYPDWQTGDWLAYAKRCCRIGPTGRILIDHDPRIAEPFRLPGGEAGPDPWLALAAFKATPVLTLRGALSDVLSKATVKRMQSRLPKMMVAEVPRVGHSPRLDEPVAVAALEDWLETVGRTA
jgi:pimeloyl-ACP methyl ester carboxylesterase